MGAVIGIDLGTTNSCVAFVSGSGSEVIANSEGSRTTPSMVALTESGEKLVGQIAKRQAVTNPSRTLFAIKRLIGRKFASSEVSAFASVAPFPIVEAENGDAWVTMGGRDCSPQEIVATILQKLKETATDYLDEEIEAAVITVPAYFNDAQRQATKEAGTIAGLEVLRIINEPTAAALSYGLDDTEEKTVAIFDLGGGTFDISILEIGNGVFQVKSTNGDTYLGGEDFDNSIVEHMANTFKDEHGIDLHADPMALQRLKEAAERAKHELSSLEETDVNLPFVASNETGPLHLVMTLSRGLLEELAASLVARLEGPCRTAVEDAGIGMEAIDELILVGGMTRMPLVRAKVAEIFGQEPGVGVNPDEGVAAGAAIQAGVLSGRVDDILLLDVTPLSLGVETQGGVFTKIIEKNTTIPSSKSQVFSTTEDNQDRVRVHVLQGERDMADDNMTLGRFELVGLPPAPRGVPQVEVTFALDPDGVAHVSAKDLGTGKSQGIVLMASSGLTEDEVERLVREAESHAEEDSAQRGRTDLCNKLEGLVYSTERTLEEFGDEVTPSDREPVEAALVLARASLEGREVADLEERIRELSGLTYSLTEKIYATLGDEGL